MLAELGSRNQAIDQYQEALAIDSHRLDTRRSLANTLVERAMHEQATGQPLATLRDATEGIEHYDIVLQALPADVVAHDNLGVALVVLGGALESQGNAAEARVAYEKALRVHPGWPVAVQGLARLADTSPGATAGLSSSAELSRAQHCWTSRQWHPRRCRCQPHCYRFSSADCLQFPDLLAWTLATAPWGFPAARIIGRLK